MAAGSREGNATGWAVFSGGDYEKQKLPPAPKPQPKESQGGGSTGDRGTGPKGGGATDHWDSTWVIVTRLSGYLDSWEMGQYQWSHVFRSRRLSIGDKFRLLARSKCSVDLADQRQIILTTNDHEIICDVSYFKLGSAGTATVRSLRAADVTNTVKRSLGIMQSRFDVEVEIRQNGNPQSIGARG